MMPVTSLWQRYATDSGWITAIGFSLDSHQFAFATSQGVLGLIDLTGKQYGERMLSVSPDAGILDILPWQDGFLISGDDGRLSAYSPSGGATVLQAETHWASQLQPLSDHAFAAVSDKHVQLFNAEGVPERRLTHTRPVNKVVWHKLSNMLAVADSAGVSCLKLDAPDTVHFRLDEPGMHRQIAISPRGDCLVTALQMPGLHCWQLGNQQGYSLKGYTARTESLAFTASGNWLATSGADVLVIWPFHDGVPVHQPPLEFSAGSGLCVQVSPHPSDDIIAAAFADGTLVFVDPVTREILEEMLLGHVLISSLAWGRAGTLLGWGSEEGQAGLINVNFQHRVRRGES